MHVRNSVTGVILLRVLSDHTVAAISEVACVVDTDSALITGPAPASIWSSLSLRVPVTNARSPISSGSVNRFLQNSRTGHLGPDSSGISLPDRTIGTGGRVVCRCLYHRSRRAVADSRHTLQ